MRWADMDLLGHVNNVTYLDYLAEAREHLFSGHGAARASVSLHQVEFVSPLVFRRRPVSVDSWVVAVTDDGLTLAHEIYDPPEDGAETRTVYLRAETTLDHRLTDAERAVVDEHRGPAHEWRPLVVESRPHGDAYSLTVRRSDVGEGGLVSDVTFFEYVQEARIQYLMNLHTRGEKWSQHVIARTDVDYREPIRPPPRAVRRALVDRPPREPVVHDPLRDPGRRPRGGRCLGGAGLLRPRDPAHRRDGAGAAHPARAGAPLSPGR